MGSLPNRSAATRPRCRRSIGRLRPSSRTRRHSAPRPRAEGGVRRVRAGQPRPSSRRRAAARVRRGHACAHPSAADRLVAGRGRANPATPAPYLVEILEELGRDRARDDEGADNEVDTTTRTRTRARSATHLSGRSMRSATAAPGSRPQRASGTRRRTGRTGSVELSASSLSAMRGARRATGRSNARAGVEVQGLRRRISTDALRSRAPDARTAVPPDTARHPVPSVGRTALRTRGPRRAIDDALWDIDDDEVERSPRRDRRRRRDLARAARELRAQRMGVLGRSRSRPRSISLSNSTENEPPHIMICKLDAVYRRRIAQAPSRSSTGRPGRLPHDDRQRKSACCNWRCIGLAYHRRPRRAARRDRRRAVLRFRRSRDPRRRSDGEAELLSSARRR